MKLFSNEIYFKIFIKSTGINIKYEQLQRKAMKIKENLAQHCCFRDSSGKFPGQKGCKNSSGRMGMYEPRGFVREERA